MKTVDFDKLLLDEASDAIMVMTPDQKVIYWNQGANLLFGYTSEEAVGHSLAELIVTPDRMADEVKVLHEGPEAYESIRRRKDGSLIYVVSSSNVVRDTKGRVEYIILSKKDITHLKVLRDAKLVETKFGNLLESTPDGIIMANSMGRIVLANSQAEKLFGYGIGELRGELVETLLPGRFRHGHVGHRSHYFKEPRTRSMGAGLELYGLKKDGTEFPVEISLSPLEVEEETLVMSAIRDTSDRKRTEQALHDKNIELQNAAQAKNRFLANMSHELRTPLNGIIGFAEFLFDGKPGPLNAKQKEYLDDILNSGRHLLQLINDVLDLAKVEAGKMEFNPERFSLQKAVEEVTAVAKPLAQKKGIVVDVKIAAALKEVKLDQQKFKQILYNLLSNAVKFSGEGGHVEIKAAPLEATRFTLAVTDHGIGIKEEDLKRLFTEFEQLESGTSRRYEGTGLGLALTRSIVELQGGQIGVKSAPGKGSTFTVTLPVETGEVSI